VKQHDVAATVVGVGLVCMLLGLGVGHHAAVMEGETKVRVAEIRLDACNAERAALLDNLRTGLPRLVTFPEGGQAVFQGPRPCAAVGGTGESLHFDTTSACSDTITEVCTSGLCKGVPR
jgi:hypothetical protein